MLTDEQREKIRKCEEREALAQARTKTVKSRQQHPVKRQLKQIHRKKLKKSGKRHQFGTPIPGAQPIRKKKK